MKKCLWLSLILFLPIYHSNAFINQMNDVNGCSYIGIECNPTPNPSPYIWISPEEISKLPTNTPDWNYLVSYSEGSVSNSTFCDQDSNVNVKVLAKALAVTRDPSNLDFSSYVSEIRSSVLNLIDYSPPSSCRTLAAGREIGAYVVSAQLVGFDNQTDETDFKDWLSFILTADLDGRTLISTHEDRPNNWGTHAGFTVMAIALYIENEEVFNHAKDVFYGWLGNQSAYNQFEFGDLCWQADQNNPVGINPLGSTMFIDGSLQNIDGVLPDDQRRGGCPNNWPPPQENYVYEALQGALAQAVVLHRQGFDVWNWEDQALLRAFSWLNDEIDFQAVGDDRWQPYVVNHFYNENFPSNNGFQPGKNIGFTEWTLSE